MGEHTGHDLLECHDVATCSPLSKKPAGAVPFFVGIAYLVSTVLSAKLCGETGESDALWFLGISFRLLYFSDEAGFHRPAPFCK